MNQRSGEISKRRILEAAKDLFAAYGYRNANMRLIAKNAGVSVGGIYIHFKNKEELFLSVIKERMETLLSELLKLKNQKKKKASELLKEIIGNVMEHAERQKDLLFIFTNMEKAKEGRRLGRRFSEQIKNIIGDVIKRGIEEGLFRDLDIREAAGVINSTLLGYVVSVIVGKKTFRKEMCSEIFLNGLLKR